MLWKYQYLTNGLKTYSIRENGITINKIGVLVKFSFSCLPACRQTGLLASSLSADRDPKESQRRTTKKSSD